MTVVCSALIGLTGMAEDAEKAAFLGVITVPVNETVSSQLGLPKGMGLVVVKTIAGSPSKGALKKNDILVKINNQKLINQSQLRTLIQAEAPGTEVTLELLRKGKTVNKKITLGETDVTKVCRSNCMHGKCPSIQVGRPGCKVMSMSTSSPTIKWFCTTNISENLSLDGDCIQKIMKSVQSDTNWTDTVPAESHKAISDAISNALKQAQNSFGVNVSDASVFSTSITTTMIEDDGVTITSSGRGDSRHLTIKDKDGKVIFDGPAATDDDKEKIPEEYRDRIKEISNISNIKIITQ